MDLIKRRFFTSEVFRKTFKLMTDIKSAYKEGSKTDDYFHSFESCYPLISEYSYFIEDEVQALGIDTSGLEDKDIAQRVYELNKSRTNKSSE